MGEDKVLKNQALFGGKLEQLLVINIRYELWIRYEILSSIQDYMIECSAFVSLK